MTKPEKHRNRLNHLNQLIKARILFNHLLAKLPKLTADRKILRLKMNFFVCSTVPSIWKVSKPEWPEHCFWNNSCWGCDGSNGWNTFNTFGCASRNCATAKPFSQCFFIRMDNVLRLRLTKKQSNGESIAPELIWSLWSVSCNSESFRTIDPAKTSLWPFMNFVIDKTTTSAPNCNGCWKYGVSSVLSITSIIGEFSREWAIFAIAAMSDTLEHGFDGVSIKIIWNTRNFEIILRQIHRIHTISFVLAFVFSLMAAFTLSASVVSIKSTVIACDSA